MFVTGFSLPRRSIIHALAQAISAMCSVHRLKRYFVFVYHPYSVKQVLQEKELISLFKMPASLINRYLIQWLCHTTKASLVSVAARYVLHKKQNILNHA